RLRHRRLCDGRAIEVVDGQGGNCLAVIFLRSIDLIGVLPLTDKMTKVPVGVQVIGTGRVKGTGNGTTQRQDRKERKRCYAEPKQALSLGKYAHRSLASI